MTFNETVVRKHLLLFFLLFFKSRFSYLSSLQKPKSQIQKFGIPLIY